MSKLTLVAFALLVCIRPVLAESCDTDCHRQCRVRTDFPPMEFIEPTCHAKCEAAKKIACATHSSVPTIPLTPREQVEQFGTQACAAPFQAITGAVIAQCSNWDGRTDDQQLIQQAAGVLVRAGLMQPSELNGVQVRWCPLNGAHGMTPDRGRIYLDVSIKGNLLATASTLAHELVHTRQYRSAGTDRFKCDYSRQYAECGGCQDRRNRFEREAYDYQDQIQGRLLQAVATTQAPAIQPPGPLTSNRFPGGWVMQGCGCWGPNPAPLATEPRCSAGSVRAQACAGMCPGGGSPYGYVCQ